ncbi:MAG: serine hydrolase [Candidatus Pacebacteria bacterium]|nr:serine hydrolase [Candidatus Paceibacterota bacterium]
MYLSPRFFIFVITIGILTGIGIVAGLNLVAREAKQNEHAIATENDLGGSIPASEQKKMVTDEPYITAPSVIQTNTPEKIIPVVKKDTITATAYLVGNLMTGKVYLSSRSTQVSPVASMSKLITAIVATNTISPTTTIEITPLETNVASDTSNLMAGEKFQFKDLLYPLLLNSSNVAAEAIASSTSRGHFLEMMSNSAWEVNMPTAYFADPSGLDPHNQASAKDIFALGQYLYVYRPDILQLTRTLHAEVSTTTDHGAHSFDSIHPYIKDERFIGGKTGRTKQAGETMLTILRIDNEPIAFIVLHSNFGARASDTDILIKKFEALTQTP